MKFTQVDHKYWVTCDKEDNILAYITSDYRNLYLKKEDRAKRPEYILWANGSKAGIFPTLKEAINHAKNIIR